jgi:predicted methyltransferase
MRKLSLVVVAAILFATGSIYANDVDSVKPSKSLSAQISNILSDNNFSNEEADLIAQVRFTLNEEGEIVVLSVDTDHVALERFVKSRLNYAKVDIANAKEGKLYTVPVRIEA